MSEKDVYAGRWVWAQFSTDLDHACPALVVESYETLEELLRDARDLYWEGMTRTEADVIIGPDGLTHGSMMYTPQGSLLIVLDTGHVELVAIPERYVGSELEDSGRYVPTPAGCLLHETGPDGHRLRRVGVEPEQVGGWASFDRVATMGTLAASPVDGDSDLPPVFVVVPQHAVECDIRDEKIARACGAP